jgi:hypothetical protein
MFVAPQENNTLTRCCFHGHGYNSDCLTHGKRTILHAEVVPEAFKVSSGNGFYNYRRIHFKIQLFEKLQKLGTDLFIIS